MGNMFDDYDAQFTKDKKTQSKQQVPTVESSPESNMFDDYDNSFKNQADPSLTNEETQFKGTGVQVPSRGFASGPLDPVIKEFNDMPWYGQADQGAQDLLRLFSTGLSYGAIDALDPEQAAMSDKARRRFPLAGQVAEMGGGLASPITRTIGAGFNMLKPAGKGILNWLGRAAATSGEGATIGATGAVISGRPEDAFKDATWGAVLPHAIKAGSKLLVTEPLKHSTAWLANKSHRDYSTAFKAGHTGDAGVSSAFRAGIRGKPNPLHGPSATPAYYAGKRLSRGSPSSRAIQTALWNALPVSALAAHPSVAALLAALPVMGSPRIGGEIANAAGTIMGGLRMLGSEGAIPALAYEQKKRGEKKKPKE